MCKKFLPALFSLLLLGAAGFFSCTYAAGPEGQSVILQSKTVEGKYFDIASVKGKVVIVHFWATWCPSCREEMPVLDNFYLHHHKEGVEAIGVSVDRPRALGDVVTYMRDFHFSTLLVSQAEKNSLGAPEALPITYIVDKQGIVRKAFTPDKEKLTQENLERAVLPLLK